MHASPNDATTDVDDVGRQEEFALLYYSEDDEEDEEEQHQFRMTIDRTSCYIFGDVHEKHQDEEYDAEGTAAAIDMRVDHVNSTAHESLALQHLLRSVAANTKAPAHERVTAHYLSLWIGTNDIDINIMRLPETRQWLAEVISGFVEKYPFTDEICRSISLQEAYETVICNFESGHDKQVMWLLLSDEN